MLKPCPFCNGKAAFGDGEQKKKFGNEQIYCTTCLVTAFPEASKEEAIKDWNTRPAVITPEMLKLAHAIIRESHFIDGDDYMLAKLVLIAATEEALQNGTHEAGKCNCDQCTGAGLSDAK